MTIKNSELGIHSGRMYGSDGKIYNIVDILIDILEALGGTAPQGE